MLVSKLVNAENWLSKQNEHVGSGYDKNIYDMKPNRDKI